MENKKALITGASRGIGEAIALKLGRSGAIVIGTATTEHGVNNINLYLQQAKIQGMGILLNVNDAEQIASALQGIREKFGDVEILVNNAGITRDNLLVRMKDEEWDEILETDLKSV
ncbi:MAG TPA: SDR family NAD(P)-dependent oxidoreductase, partial [Nitrosomonas sp.]|nr:SDR family NAD(P)-dependent oxidoreductase [Nitrosomonas sp.]